MTVPIESAADPLSPVESAGIVVRAAAQAIPRIVDRVVGAVPQLHVILIGGFVTALVLGVAVGPRRQCHGGFRESKVDVAKLITRQLANEAYRRWAADHRGFGCPRSLYDLGPYMDHRDIKDPWGHDYQFRCADGRMVARSLGEDGRPNTGDDIWSNEGERP